MQVETKIGLRKYVVHPDTKSLHTLKPTHIKIIFIHSFKSIIYLLYLFYNAFLFLLSDQRYTVEKNDLQ